MIFADENRMDMGLEVIETLKRLSSYAEKQSYAEMQRQLELYNKQDEEMRRRRSQNAQG